MECCTTVNVGELPTIAGPTSKSLGVREAAAAAATTAAGGVIISP